MSPRNTPPSAPSQAPPAAPPAATAAQNQAAATVQASADATQQAVQAAVGPQMSEAPKYGSFLNYSALPTLGGVKKVAIAGGTALAVMNPIGFVAVAGPAWAGVKVWGKLNKYPPFSWVHNAGASVINGATNAVKTTASVVTYPLRLTAVAGINTLKFGARRGIDTLRFGVNTINSFRHFVHDLFVHAEGETKNILEKILDFPGWYIHKLLANPVATIIGSMATIGFITSPVLVSDTIVQVVMRFLSYLAGGA